MSRVVTVIATAMIVVGLSACAGSDDDRHTRITNTAAQMAKDAGHESQYELLQDGTLSKEDYEQALNNLLTCFSERNIEMVDLTVNPVDGLRYLYGYDLGGLDPDAGAEFVSQCEQAHWNTVSGVYAGTHSPTMDTALMTFASACMEDAGFSLTGSEKSMLDLVQDISDSSRSSAAVECVEAALLEIYPDIPLLVINY